MKSMVTKPNSVASGCNTGSSGDGGNSSGHSGGTNGETDKLSAKLAGCKSGPKGDHVTVEKTTEVKKKGKLQRLEVGPQKNDKHGPEDKAGLEDVPLPIEADIPLPPQKSNEVKDGQGTKEGSDKEEDKGGVVSFSFKKTGAKLGITALISEEDEKQETNSSSKSSEKPKKILSAFTKVQNKDGTMELDWPSEMIQHTKTQPVITFSCNPLMFDFTALFMKPNAISEKLKFLTEETQKEVPNDKIINSNSVVPEVKDEVDTEKLAVQDTDKIVNNNTSKKSKKKKKRKHKKHLKEAKSEKEKKEDGHEGEKKKKKKKRKHNDEKGDNKENKDSLSKKRSYRKRTADAIAECGNESDDKKGSKHKKRKKSKKPKKSKKQIEDKSESKKGTEKIKVVKSKAKKSSNVLEHLIDEVDGTDIKIKKENSNETKDSKAGGKKLKPVITNNESENKQTGKSPITDTQHPVNAKNTLKVEKTTGSNSSRKRQTSESSHSEATPSSVKKQKLTPHLSKEAEKSVPVKQEDTWSKMEHIFEPKVEENPKSKWDTSDSDGENKMDVATKQKKLTKKAASPNTVKKESPKVEKPSVKTESNSVVNKKSKSKSYDSSERSYSRSRSRTKRSRRSSYSYSSSRSRSRSYSTSSYDSRSRSRSSSYSRSRSRSRRYRSSSYSSYSSGYSRSRSHSRRSYSRSRSRYSSYSRSRSRSSRYSTSRSRSRSYSRSRSRHSKRSYSQSSHSSDNSTKVMNRKQRRRRTLKKKQSEMSKIDPLSIPLPDLGKDIKTEPNNETIESEVKQETTDPMNIPLPTKIEKTEKVNNVNLLPPPPPPPGEQPLHNNPPVMPNYMPPPPPPGMGMGPGPGMYPGMPFDPRMRMPLPHYPNMPPPHYNGPYPGPHPYSQDISKSRSPPPLPPPRSPSPQPPPPPKKEEEKKEVEAMSMDIPADQAERFQKLQKQAQKHAMRQLKRQMRQLKGENPSDTSSSEEEEEEKTTSSQQGDEVDEDIQQLLPIMSPSVSMGQPTYILTQPQQASSAQIVIGSDGRQFIIPGAAASSLAGAPIQAGAPMFAMPGASQPTLVALPAGAGATPAHMTGAVQSPFLTGGLPYGASSLFPGHHPLLAQSQLGALGGLHQQMLQPGLSGLSGLGHPGHHGAIVVGNQILIPRLMRPAL